MNILKILTPKNENFQIKKSDIFLISAQNIACWYSLEPPRRGGSNEYSQSMLLSRNKKNKVYPCKPQFYYIKVGFNGVKIYRHVCVMYSSTSFGGMHSNIVAYVFTSVFICGMYSNKVVRRCLYVTQLPGSVKNLKTETNKAVRLIPPVFMADEN